MISDQASSCLVWHEVNLRHTNVLISPRVIFQNHQRMTELCRSHEQIYKFMNIVHFWWPWLTSVHSHWPLIISITLLWSELSSYLDNLHVMRIAFCDFSDRYANILGKSRKLRSFLTLNDLWWPWLRSYEDATRCMGFAVSDSTCKCPHLYQ